jgi:hypothetical protein
MGTMKDPMRSHSVTIRMTPRQAIAALRALDYCALREEGRMSSQMYGAAGNVRHGLSDAGWEDVSREGWMAWKRREV